MNTIGTSLARITLLTVISVAANAQENANAPVFNLLFTAQQNLVDGYPVSLVETSIGTFYGLSTLQSATLGASVFSINYAGNIQNVYTSQPYVYLFSMIQALNGKLYLPGGSMQGARHYQYIAADLSGSVQSYPTPQWVLGPASVTTPSGLIYTVIAPPNGVGTTFIFAQIDLNGIITPLHKFAGTDGFPYSGTILIQGHDGDIYGIALKSLSGLTTGWLYKITPQGQYSKVAGLPVDGAGGLAAPIIAATDGSIYGAFPRGGVSKTGMIYKVAADGTYQKLLDFPATGMTQPAFLVEGTDGNLYGSTDGAPSYLFQFNLKTLKLRQLYKLSGNEGICACAMVQGMDGKFYATSPVGGLYGFGTIFSLDLGLPKPKPFVSLFSPTTGATGQPILLWGRNLLGATSVRFNGVAASPIAVNSTQAVSVAVPAGATSGPITITTPNGTFTTTTSFQVP